MKGYRYGHRYRLEHDITVCVGTCPLFPQMHPKQIVVEMNPSKFDSLGYFLSFLENIFQGIDLGEPTINRLDLCVDTVLPFSSFYEHLVIANLREAEIIRSTSNTMVVGKGNRRVNIYDKAAKDGRVDTVLTRVEIQYRGNKCPVRSIFKLGTLKDFDPFEGFEFYGLANTSDRCLVLGVGEAIKREGLQNAKRRVIRSERFKRWVERGIFTRLAEPDLSSKYRHEMSIYCGPEAVEEGLSKAK